MQKRLPLALLPLLALTLAAGPAPNSPFQFPNFFPSTDPDPATIQKQLDASNEEFSVIWPKLQHIIQLQNDLNASVDASPFPFGMLPGTGFSMGGSGLEAPDNLGMSAPPATNPAPGAFPGFGGAAPGMPNMANQADPFNPQKIPGLPSAQPGFPGMPAGGFGGMGGGKGMGGMGGAFSSTGNSLLTLLTELQTLLSDKTTPEDQLKEKLALIRAARAKTQQDLQASQQDLLQLLTPHQAAALMTQGYLN